MGFANGTGETKVSMRVSLSRQEARKWLGELKATDDGGAAVQRERGRLNERTGVW